LALVDLSDEAGRGLKAEPFQTVVPEAVGVAREEGRPSRPDHPEAFPNQRQGIDFKGRDPVLDAEHGVEGSVPETQSAGVHGRQSAVGIGRQLRLSEVQARQGEVDADDEPRFHGDRPQNSSVAAAELEDGVLRANPGQNVVELRVQVAPDPGRGDFVNPSQPFGGEPFLVIAHHGHDRIIPESGNHISRARTFFTGGDPRRRRRRRGLRRSYQEPAVLGDIFALGPDGDLADECIVVKASTSKLPHFHLSFSTMPIISSPWCHYLKMNKDIRTYLAMARIFRQIDLSPIEPLKTPP